MDHMPKLLYECPSFIIMEKPHGLATVPLKKQVDENDSNKTLLWYAASIAPQVMDVHGKNPWEGGAIHRLDTATSGMVMFAKDQSFYDYMQGAQQKDLFEKYYTAKTIENDALKGMDINENDNIITITSYFRPYGPRARQVRPTLDPKKAQPKQEYTTLARRNRLTAKGENVFLCTITKGFRHQIRAHLAWTGHPIEGDQLYCSENLQNTEQCENQHLQLTCVGMAFQNQQGCVQAFLKNDFSNDFSNGFPYNLSIEDFPHTPWFASQFATQPTAQFAKTGCNGIIEL